MPVEQLKSIFDIGTVILAGLVFLFGAGALLTGNIINERQAAQLRAFDRDLKAKDVRIAQAAEGAAEANRLAEKERLARVEIEAKVAWRRLTKPQQEAIGLHLANLPPQTVSMWFMAQDAECQRFAADITIALRRNTSWAVGPPGGIARLSPGGALSGPIIELPTGVIIGATSDLVSQSAADAIVHELLILGFNATKTPKPDPDKRSPQIWVQVEHRPDGPQGEYKLEADKAHPLNR